MIHSKTSGTHTAAPYKDNQLLYFDLLCSKCLASLLAFFLNYVSAFLFSTVITDDSTLPTLTIIQLLIHHTLPKLDSAE